MQIAELKGKKITVMGLGLHGGGIGTTRFLVEAGAHVTVTDMSDKEKLAPSLEKLKEFKDVVYVLGQHRPENFTAADMVVKNPAVPWNNKYIQLALENKIPVEMDSSLFFKLSKNPIIGVTGTKGKTTAASLICSILKMAGKEAVKVGIGQASVLDKIRDLKKETMVVFELSSWRLSALGRYKLSPAFAVITNLYPDHLNYYKSMKEYEEDKKNIFLYQKKEDFCIINADNEVIKNWEMEIKSQLIRYSKNKIKEGRSVYLDGGNIYFNNGVDEKKIIEIKEIKLKGEHNLENTMAAVAAGLVAGAKIEAIRKAVADFSGVAHRLELVRELKGIKYINDTAATTPEAAVAALNSFSEPIILICGGSDKKLDMAELGQAIFRKTKGVVFLKGPATDKIIAAIKCADEKGITEDFKIADSMEEALALAKADAQKDDVVLLSPGAASFGMFINEFDRGEKFREAVKKLN
jgi:UDP-N-acetylmuramoylalanine--D-glutamate ligase